MEGNPGAVGDGFTNYEDFGERRLVGALNLTVPFSAGFLVGELAGGGKYTRLNRDRDLHKYFSCLSAGRGHNTVAAAYLLSLGAAPDSANQHIVCPYNY